MKAPANHFGLILPPGRGFGGEARLPRDSTSQEATGAQGGPPVVSFRMGSDQLPTDSRHGDLGSVRDAELGNQPLDMQLDGGFL